MTRIRPDVVDLARAIEALRLEEARVETPRRVEAAVLEAWDAAHVDARTTPAAAGWLRRASGIAAAVALAATLGLLGSLLHRSAERAPRAGGRTLILVGGPILEGEPVRVVRMRLPAATLAAIGVSPAQTVIAAHVEVDVLVGEDGVARAIRVGM